MAETFEDLVRWLFWNKPLNSVAQVGMADGSKRALIWLPGRADKPSRTTVRSEDVAFLGCTNRAYPNHHTAMQDQPSWLCWLGIDVDGTDNPSFKTHELFETIARVCPEASLRVSCGGRGVHVIQRLATPISIPANPLPGTHSRITKWLNSPMVNRLEANGVRVCKSDSRMFWLFGGQNRWLARTEEFMPVPDNAGLLAESAPPDKQTAEAGAHDPFVQSWLEKLGVRPGAVYVGTVVSRLRALGETVNTRSPMSGNGRVNGFVDVGVGSIGLWSYADGTTIWRTIDDTRMLESVCGAGPSE